MDGKREQAFVGLFVLIAVALLLVTIFSLTGFLSRTQPHSMPSSLSPAASSPARKYATRAARRMDGSLLWLSTPMTLR